MTLNICLAGPEDGEAILNLQKKAFQSEAAIYDNYEIPPLVQTLPEILDEFKTKTFIKAEEGGKCVGSVRACMQGNVCHIARLIVEPTRQNQGIGSKLMDEIESMFAQAQKFCLETGYLSKKNLALYERRGYQCVSQNKISDKVIMVCLEKNPG